jgi:DNA (cytosine-5)-methyltransferase 1
MSRAYYNDNDRNACAWLRELIARGLIAPGDVDERSIHDVTPADVAGYDQCHWFAGIGGWSYALRLAGWPDDRPVWTGSCPCQPFSSAGKRHGARDPRHLAPVWLRLVAECRPSVVFGEQVEAAAAAGWLDELAVSLERCGYRVGAAVLPAAGVAAPHGRHRLWFVADTGCERGAGQGGHGNVAGAPSHREGAALERERPRDAAGNRGEAGGLADADGDGLQGSIDTGAAQGAALIDVRGLVDADGRGCSEQRLEELPEQHGALRRQPDGPSSRGWWDRAVPHLCRDGITRPLEPGIEPLAHGIPGRVGLLRGYGNAIVPQVASSFVMAYMEACDE